MELRTYFEQDWKPALGCTEPAAVAYGAALAAEQAAGEVSAVHLVCDRRVYKNGYAAGIPHSGGRAGIEWALAAGAVLPDASGGLESFRRLDPDLLGAAERLIAARGVTAEVLPDRAELLIDCRVTRAGGTGRALIEGHHTRVRRLEQDGRAQPVASGEETRDRSEEVDAWLRGLSFSDCIALARALGPAERECLRAGCELNLEIARHGLALLPPEFVEASRGNTLAEVSCLVCAGVFARMSGAERTVMTLAGSGNKGITVAVPLARWSEENDAGDRLDAALALACLLTSATTRRLGTLSTMCGCANAAGIGLAAGLVFLQGGGEEGLSRAVNNMVANVPGMICDGAKMGCGLKASTAVDAAFRAASLAVSGFGVLQTDGIVAEEAAHSLDNLERVARRGMGAMDAEILQIMQEKLG